MLAIFITAALAATPSAAPKPAVNTICPVTGDPVPANAPKAVVNGQEYKLCCGGCKKKLEKNPSAYLNPDGSLIKKAK